MIIERIFELLCTCETISEFKMKCTMSTSFEIGSKPLPRGMSLFLISKISECLFPSRYYFWHQGPVSGRHHIESGTMLNLVRNLYDLTESCELFSMLNPEDTTEIRRQMTDWISSDRNFTNKAYPYVCKLISVLSKVGK